MRAFSLVGLAALMLSAPGAARPSAMEAPDRLYADRSNLANAMRAADLWSARAATDFEASWKLSRICYWLGGHAPARSRRGALERGIGAGVTAIRLNPGRPEGHFWLAANMGGLAESFGIVQGLKYRGQIKEELERVLAIDPGWQGGSADAALGQWYFEVPRLLGGSLVKAEVHLRQALSYDSRSLVALSMLADVLAANGRHLEARGLLLRVLDAPVDPDWIPEDREFKQKANERLESLTARAARLAR